MAYKLISLDMDGVVFKDTNFWLELHKVLGTLEEGTKLTKKYLKTDYEKLKNEVIGRLWKGKDATEYYKLVKCKFIMISSFYQNYTIHFINQRSPVTGLLNLRTG